MSITQRAARSIVGLAIAAAALLSVGRTASAVPSSACSGSHHSNSGNGANASGSYDSTCDGSASQNGVGAGKATGRPCAGCVGNADDKNPPGQAPDGTDANAGALGPGTPRPWTVARLGRTQPSGPLAGGRG